MPSTVALCLLTLAAVSHCPCGVTASSPMTTPWEHPCADQDPFTELHTLQTLAREAVNLINSLHNNANGVWETSAHSWMSHVHMNHFPSPKDLVAFPQVLQHGNSAALTNHYEMLSRLCVYLEHLRDQSTTCRNHPGVCFDLNATLLRWLCLLSRSLTAVPSPASRLIMPDSSRYLVNRTVCDLRDAILLKDTTTLLRAMEEQYVREPLWFLPV